MSRHACLARSESLNNARSLKPIPPSSFDFVDSDHLIQCIFLLSPRCPQKNFLTIASMSWHRPKGILKHPMEYVGMAWTIALIRTSLPAWDKSFPFPPLYFSPNPLLYIAKACFFSHSHQRRQPQIFLIKLYLLHPQHSFYLLSSLLFRGLAKEKGCLFSIDFLARYRFIFWQYFENISTLLGVGLAKKQAIICKIQVG